tara:strand:- start:209 stop:316 length:108 start_codon:yes stop_codon:yes gene_type:complete
MKVYKSFFLNNRNIEFKEKKYLSLKVIVINRFYGK